MSNQTPIDSHSFGSSIEGVRGAQGCPAAPWRRRPLSGVCVTLCVHGRLGGDRQTVDHSRGSVGFVAPRRNKSMPRVPPPESRLMAHAGERSPQARSAGSSRACAGHFFTPRRVQRRAFPASCRAHQGATQIGCHIARRVEVPRDCAGLASNYPWTGPLALSRKQKPGCCAGLAGRIWPGTPGQQKRGWFETTPLFAWRRTSQITAAACPQIPARLPAAHRVAAFAAPLTT